MEKMTNIKALDYIITTYGEELPEDVAEKVTAIKNSFVKKSENRKPTKTQEQNAEIKTAILGVLGTEGITASEVMAKVTAEGVYTELSLPKVTALLTQLKDDKQVTRTQDKKKVLFSLA